MSEECHQCLEHSAHERAIRKHDEALSSVQSQILAINECIVKLTTLQEQSMEWRDRVDERVTDLENVPKTRWNQVVATAVTAVVSAIIGVVIASVGFGA